MSIIKDRINIELGDTKRKIEYNEATVKNKLSYIQSTIGNPYSNDNIKMNRLLDDIIYLYENSELLNSLIQRLDTDGEEVILGVIKDKINAIREELVLLDTKIREKECDILNITQMDEVNVYYLKENLDSKYLELDICRNKRKMVEDRINMLYYLVG